ncbi:MAG: SDR family oxidoreductase [Rhodothalassiaceae bacterium]
MTILHGKTALITGAAQGIGLAIAQRFAEGGAHVIVSDIGQGAGQDAARSIGAAATYRPLDVQAEADWRALGAWLAETEQTVSILVNNAGITGLTETAGPHDPEHLDLASWQAVLDTNLTGVALGCKYAIAWMKAAGGSIINLSSRSGQVGIPGAAAYAASKAAVRNHTKSVALYCAEQGYAIRCNSLHPAAILTPMWDAMLGEGQARDDAIAAIAADIPLRRFGMPQDVAEAALYLAADGSAYVTGTELVIDGGLLAGTAARPGDQ